MPIERGERSKKYKSGDQINFIVTRKFVETANDFAAYCEENGVNFSEAIRKAMDTWLQEKVAKERDYELLMRGTSSLKRFADSYEQEVLKEV